MNNTVKLACLFALSLAGAAPAETKAQADEVEALRKQARGLLRQGHRDQAAAKFEEALAKCDKHFEENDVRTAGACLELGQLYHDQQQYAKAQRLYLRCLSIRKKALGDHFEVAVVLHELGRLALHQGHNGAAVGRLEESLRVKRKVKKADDLSIALTLNSLGQAHQALRQFDKAEDHFKQAVAICQKNRDKDPLAVTRPAISLAVYYRDQGQLERAEKLLLQCRKICEAHATKPDADAQLARVLHNLAAVQRGLAHSGPPAEAKERYSSAAELYRRSLAIWDGRAVKDARAQADSLNNLGATYMDLRRFKDAKEAWGKCLRLREQTLDKEHPTHAELLHNIAGLLHVEKDYAGAEKLFRRSLAIRKARLGKDHSAVADSLNQLAGLLKHKGEHEKAAELLDEARRISRTHLGRALAGLAEDDQAALIAFAERRDYDRALAMQPNKDDLILTRDATTITRKAATWLLNGKAMGQEALARSALLSRDARDPKLRGLAADLRRKREELSRLSVSGLAADQKDRLDRLKAEELEFARKLAKAGGAGVPPVEWHEVDELHQAIPEGAVLIDVARYRGFDYTAPVGQRQREARYGAWIIGHGRKLHAVDLGKADAIDDAVARVVRAMENSADPLRKQAHLGVYNQLLEGPLQKLSDLVLKPLINHVGSERRWVVSPDGALWMVPWEMLLLPNGKFAVQEHSFSYVLSGRDLLVGSSYSGAKGKPLVVADPDYGPASRGERNPLRKVVPLPDTRNEATAVAKSIRQYTGDDPEKLLGARALKAEVKTHRNPRVLVLSTHGFFLPQQHAELSDDGPGSAKAKVPVGYKNPLSRCGLLLAGCNNGANKADDGVLTGLEVLGMDLRGCEMVVLSACETGRGEVRNGEGVAGLRQAFRLAGAETVVSTLWQVPSTSSGVLMADFFKGLTKTPSRSSALRQAQLKAIEEREEGPQGFAHPFFWAAFTITGKG